MSPFRFSRRAGLAAVATLALTLTACGGDGETTDTASPTTDATTSDEATDDAEAPAETVDLTVGVIPIL
ncbi:MAG: iron-siderophore ABC transporter substrate-binding protein, partial [Tetrasphaera sp.]|nr:iron-siderophore ABC transporter substrate-binding protein [Tetrasphaera sp.]